LNPSGKKQIRQGPLIAEGAGKVGDFFTSKEVIERFEYLEGS